MYNGCFGDYVDQGCPDGDINKAMTLFVKELGDFCADRLSEYLRLSKEEQDARLDQISVYDQMLVKITERVNEHFDGS